MSSARRRMYELFALTVGAMLGIALHRRTTRIMVLGVAGCALATGVFVSSMSGELAISWGFLVFDIGQVVAAAVGLMLLMRAFERRRAAS